MLSLKEKYMLYGGGGLKQVQVRVEGGEEGDLSVRVRDSADIRSSTLDCRTIVLTELDFSHST